MLNESFILIDNVGMQAISGVFANAPVGFYTDAAGDRFLVNYLADMGPGSSLLNDVTLTYLGGANVPEPGTWACLVAGGAGWYAAVRRRRASRVQAGLSVRHHPCGRFAAW